MRIFAKTDIGKVREMNQDFYFVSSDNEEPKLFILADGMGGYNGGEIASKMAVQTVHDFILDNWKIVERSEEDILKLLKDATLHANKLVYEKSKTDPNLKGMGTTLDVCIIYNGIIYISHIGDSRIYKITEENINLLTSDHTYVQKLLSDGTITKEEAKTHPDRHMLLKALGCNEDIEPDIFASRWNLDEQILLCSDGLTNMLSDEQIHDIAINYMVAPEKTFINMANDMGGLDNITVILIKH